MKNIIIFILFLLVLIPFSCTEDVLDEINENPNSPSEVPISLILPQTEAQSFINIGGGLAGIYSGFFAQHYSNVHLNQRLPSDISSSLWTAIYNNLLDLKTIIDMGSEGGKEEGNYAAVGIAKFLYCYTLSIGTDLYGDMPHTQAILGSTNRDPQFDSQKDIYEFIINYLDEAIQDLQKPSIGSVSNYDLILKGDVERWIKSAYALKIRLFNRLSNIDPGSSSQNIIESIEFTYKSSNENLVFDKYLPGSSNQNPWTKHQNSQQGIAISETIIDLMKEINSADPRFEVWFTKIQDKYIGAPVNNKANSDVSHTTYSTVKTTFLRDDTPQPILTYEEIKFIEAEAYLRQNNHEAANVAYETAIIESLRRNEIEEEKILEYVSSEYVFPGSDNLTLKNIIEQKYLSLWMFQSIEAYNDFRRTGIPDLKSSHEIPKRIGYPSSEFNRNKNTPSEINDITIYEIPVWWAEP